MSFCSLNVLHYQRFHVLQLRLVHLFPFDNLMLNDLLLDLMSIFHYLDGVESSGLLDRQDTHLSHDHKLLYLKLILLLHSNLHLQY